MEQSTPSTDDLNILNKCTTDDDKVISVQNNIRFFEKPPQTKDANKPVWNQHISNEQDDGKRWSYQKAIQKNYSKNNKDKIETNVSKTNENKNVNRQSIILDKINKLKENQTANTKTESKSKLRKPVEYKRYFSNEETASNNNASYRSPYLDNIGKRKSLNNIENTTVSNQNLADSNVNPLGQQRKMGNVNFNNKLKSKEFEKVLISNQMKNISNKFENRKSKVVEADTLSTNDVNINKLGNYKQTGDKADVSLEKDKSSTNLKRNTSGSVKNLTETSFLNISSTSLNEEESESNVGSSDESNKINRTIQDIETIAHQIENLTFHVNNTVNTPFEHKPSEHTLSDSNLPDTINETTNAGAINNNVTQTNEHVESEYLAIGKTLEKNLNIVTAMNQSHIVYQLEDPPIDGLEETKAEQIANDIKIPKDSKECNTNFSTDKTTEIKDENHETVIDPSVHNNIFKTSHHGSPLPDLVIGSVEALDTKSNELSNVKQNILNDLDKEHKQDHHIKDDHGKHTDEAQKLVKEIDNKSKQDERLDKEEHTKEVEAIKDVPVITTEDIKTEDIDKSKTEPDDSLNPFADSDEEAIDRIETSADSSLVSSPLKASSTKDIDYPEELNPFGDDDEESLEDVSKASLDLSKGSLDISRTSQSTNPFGDALDDDLDKSNPFFSDLEEEEKVELKKTPVPTPR